MRGTGRLTPLRLAYTAWRGKVAGTGHTFPFWHSLGVIRRHVCHSDPPPPPSIRPRTPLSRAHDREKAPEWKELGGGQPLPETYRVPTGERSCILGILSCAPGDSEAGGTLGWGLGEETEGIIGIITRTLPHIYLSVPRPADREQKEVPKTQRKIDRRSAFVETSEASFCRMSSAFPQSRLCPDKAAGRVISQPT